jgi:hypothetical protein
VNLAAGFSFFSIIEKLPAILVRAPLPPEAPRSGHLQRLVTVSLAQGYGYGYGSFSMRTISLRLTSEEAIHLSHTITDRLDSLAKIVGTAISEDRKDDAMKTARCAGHLQRVQDNLDTLGRQHFIGW